jgi:hypothetical protein
MNRPWLKIAVLLLAIPVATAVATVGPRFFAASMIACCGTDTSGVITNKNESIDFVHENWLHRYDVTFNYQAQGNTLTQTATHMVDTKTYDRLKVGDRVPVTYLSGKWVAQLPVQAVLKDSSVWDRETAAGGFWSDTMHTAAVFLAATVLVFSSPGRMRLTGMVGTAGLGSGLYLAGWLIFPLLFVLWRKLPDKDFGVALVASLLLGAVVMAERMPWPSVSTGNNTVEGTAVVNQIAKVDRIWGAINGAGRSTPRSGVMINRQRPGIAIDPPYYLVDLRVTSPGMNEPVHAVDRIDTDSIHGLFGGATIHVRFPQGSPRKAMIEGAKRDYAFEAWTHLILWTMGTSLLALPLMWPLVAFGVRMYSGIKWGTSGGNKGGQVSEKLQAGPPDSSSH